MSNHNDDAVDLSVRNWELAYEDKATKNAFRRSDLAYERGDWAAGERWERRGAELHDAAYEQFCDSISPVMAGLLRKMGL